MYTCKSPQIVCLIRLIMKLLIKKQKRSERGNKKPACNKTDGHEKNMVHIVPLVLMVKANISRNTTATAIPITIQQFRTWMELRDSI